MSASNRQWGVTPPISTSLPTPAELLANDTLIAELKRQNNFEGSDETERRLRVLPSSLELSADDVQSERIHFISYKRSQLSSLDKSASLGIYHRLQLTPPEEKYLPLAVIGLEFTDLVSWLSSTYHFRVGFKVKTEFPRLGYRYPCRCSKACIQGGFLRALSPNTRENRATWCH